MRNDQEAPSARKVPCNLQVECPSCGRGPAPVDKRGGDSMSRWRIVGVLFGLDFFQLSPVTRDEC